MLTNSVGKIVAWNIPNLKPRTCEKLNPLFWFGNIDDPVPPDWYRPKSKMRNFLWNCRNPFHNLFFYVIGIADKEFKIVGRCPGRISNPDGGWNWTVCQYKWLRLPLVSYQRGKFYFYLGWRSRGNFGMKLNYSDRNPGRTVLKPHHDPPACDILRTQIIPKLFIRPEAAAELFFTQLDR